MHRLPPATLYASDAQDRLLRTDRAAAAWHTWKPPPQVAELLHPSGHAPLPEGSGHWIGAPRVRAIDDELQVYAAASPRRAPRDSMDASPRGSTHRRKWDDAEIGRLAANGTEGLGPATSLTLPSMGASRPWPDGWACAPGHPSPSAAGGLGMAPAAEPAARSPRSGRRPGGYERARDSAATSLEGGFDAWMEAQRAPAPVPSLGHGRFTFDARLRAEALHAEPTPFTHGLRPAARHGVLGSSGSSPRGSVNNTPEASPIMRRSHHPDLWPQGERAAHPHRSACHAETLEPASLRPVLMSTHVERGDGVGERGDGVGGASPRSLRSEATEYAERSHHSGQEFTALAATPASEPAYSPSFFRRQSTDLTRGFQGGGGRRGGAGGATVQDSLSDYLSGRTAAPAPAGLDAQSPIDAHRRGRSDLQYIASSRHERAEQFAREKELRSGADSWSFHRHITSATQPQLDELSAARTWRASDPAAGQAGLGVAAGGGAALASSDLHAGTSARAYRLAQALTRRNE